MFKYIYLIRGSSTEDYKKFKKRIFKTAESFTGNFDQLKLTLSELAPPAVSIIPFKKKEDCSHIRICKERTSCLTGIEGCTWLFRFIQGY